MPAVPSGSGGPQAPRPSRDTVEVPTSVAVLFVALIDWSLGVVIAVFAPWPLSLVGVGLFILGASLAVFAIVVWVTARMRGEIVPRGVDQNQDGTFGRIP